MDRTYSKANEEREYDFFHDGVFMNLSDGSILKLLINIVCIYYFNVKTVNILREGIMNLLFRNREEKLTLRMGIVSRRVRG